MARIRLIIGLCLLAILPAFVLGQEAKKDPFESFKNRSNSSFKKFQTETDKRFSEYEAANKAAFEEFRNRLNKFWGKDQFKESTNKDWVEYGDDEKSRRHVDFEKEEATVELLLSPEEAANATLVKARLEAAVEELATDRGQTRDYETAVEKPEPLSKVPVLKGQLITTTGEEVTPVRAASFAREVVESKAAEQKTIKGDDQQKRVVVSLSIPLAPDGIKKRANFYLPDVQKYAQKYALPTELILAVMHTESYFNPKAKSWVPAYGLMQLVPKYAGLEAYRYVYKADKMLPANYLYKASNNIELGSAYLHLLMSRYFKKIEDPVSRMYCSIAAYNTGAGNVSKAFIGTTKLYKAIPKINAMTAKQVYRHLEMHLPYQETRDYIKRVTTRMDKYKQWSNL